MADRAKSEQNENILLKQIIEDQGKNIIHLTQKLAEADQVNSQQT